MPWDQIHRLGDLLGVATIIGLAWRYALAVRKLFRWIEGDHKKVTALWREHGYNSWDGVERRNVRDRLALKG